MSKGNLFQIIKINFVNWQNCRDPGSNRGPLDLQSNALPTELSRPLIILPPQRRNRNKLILNNRIKNISGSTEI